MCLVACGALFLFGNEAQGAPTAAPEAPSAVPEAAAAGAAGAAAGAAGAASEGFVSAKLDIWKNKLAITICILYVYAVC